MSMLVEENTTNKSMHTKYKNKIVLDCNLQKYILFSVTFQGSDTPNLAFQRPEGDKEYHEVNLPWVGKGEKHLT